MGSALHYCHGGLGRTVLSLGVRSASPLYVDPSLAVNAQETSSPRTIPFEALRTHQKESMGKTADQVSNRSTSNTTEQCHTKDSQSLATITIPRRILTRYLECESEARNRIIHHWIFEGRCTY